MTDDGRYNLDVLGACAALHASRTGISDPLPIERVRTIVGQLRKRLETWNEATPLTEPYDNCVHALIVVALQDGEHVLKGLP